MIIFHLLLMQIKLEDIEKKYELCYLNRFYLISRSDLLEILERDHPEVVSIILSKDPIESKINELVSLKLDYSFDFIGINDGKILKESIMFTAKEMLFQKDHLECAEFTAVLSVKNDLYKLFNNHILSYKNDLFLFDELYKKYPQYVYTGLAYRFVHASKYDQSSSIIGKSFSLNKEGIKFFTENYFFLNATIIKHNIVGFNLIKFLYDHEKEVIDLGYEIVSEHFQKEQEIIVLEDLGVISIQNVGTRQDLVDYLESSF